MSNESLPLTGSQFRSAEHPLRIVTVAAKVQLDHETKSIFAATQHGIISGVVIGPGQPLHRGDPVLRITPCGSSSEDVFIPSPWTGRVLSIARLATSFSQGDPLFTILSGLIVDALPGQTAGLFDADAIIACAVSDGEYDYRAIVRAVTIGSNGFRRVRLVVQDPEDTLSVGAMTTVNLHIQPTPAMIDAEVAERLGQRPTYAYPPRGVERVRLGIDPPRREPVRHARDESDPARRFVKTGPARDVGSFTPAGGLRSRAETHRAPLAFTSSVWSKLGIATCSIRSGSVNTHVDVDGQIGREAAPAQVFNVTAPIVGVCQMSKRFVSQDLIRSAEQLGVVIVEPVLIEAQEALLAALKLSDKDAEVAAQERLEELGLPATEINSLSRERVVKREIAIYAPIDGVLETIEGIGSTPILAGTTVATIRAVNTTFITCELPVAEFKALPTIVDIRRLGTDATAHRAPLLEVQPGRTLGFIRVRIPLSLLNIGDQPTTRYQRFRIEDPATRHTALLVPEDCVLPVAASQEVLLHIGPGAVCGASVTCGRRADGHVEIVAGLAADAVVARDLAGLYRDVQEIRALMIGFWQPSASFTLPTFSKPNLLIG